MEPVYLLCPHMNCRKLLSVPAEARGQLVTCRYCQKTIRVPVPKQAASVAPPAGDQASRRR